MLIQSIDVPPARRRLSWSPGASALRRMLGWFTAGGALIGLIGFAASFASISQAAYPYMGRGAFTLPLLVDLGIFTLSGVAIVLELHEISSWWIRLIPNALAGFTIYLNTATQHSGFGKAVHAAGPALWVIVVEIATFTVRRMVALSSENTIGKVRGSRWLLAPASTLRLWRRMRLWEITDYRTAISREHERAASVALLRQWYGRAWRAVAPRAERLAVRLQGSTDEPVADLLSRACAGITAAALAAAKPAPPVDEALRPLDPITYPAHERAVRPPFAWQIAPFFPRANTLTEAGAPAAADPAPEPEDEAGTAARLRAEGLSYGQIAARMGRSKTWVFEAVNSHPAQGAPAAA